MESRMRERKRTKVDVLYRIEEMKEDKRTENNKNQESWSEEI